MEKSLLPFSVTSQVAGDQHRKALAWCPGVLLTLRDLTTPVLPHEHPGWLWCWSLHGPSPLHKPSMGIFTVCLPPCGWHPHGLARGLYASPFLRVESRVPTSTSSISRPCDGQGNQDWNHVQSVSSSMLAHFCFRDFVVLFLFVFISFSAFYSLAPNRE